MIQAGKRKRKKKRAQSLFHITFTAVMNESGTEFVLLHYRTADPLGLTPQYGTEPELSVHPPQQTLDSGLRKKKKSPSSLSTLCSPKKNTNLNFHSV